jgi:hypothetical protein
VPQPEAAPRDNPPDLRATVAALWIAACHPKTRQRPIPLALPNSSDPSLPSG